MLDSCQNISERGKRRVGDKREVIDLKGEPHSNYDINTNWLILWLLTWYTPLQKFQSYLRLTTAKIITGIIWTRLPYYTKIIFFLVLSNLWDDKGNHQMQIVAQNRICPTAMKSSSIETEDHQRQFYIVNIILNLNSTSCVLIVGTES